MLQFRDEDQVGIHGTPLPPLERLGRLVLVGPPRTPNVVDVDECQLEHDKHEATSDRVLAVRSSKDALEVWLDVKPRAVAEQGPQWSRAGAVEDDVVERGWDLARAADCGRARARRKKQSVCANRPDEGDHLCQRQGAQHEPRAWAPSRVAHGRGAIGLGQSKCEVLD